MAIFPVTPRNLLLWTFLMENFNLGIGENRVLLKTFKPDFSPIPKLKFSIKNVQNNIFPGITEKTAIPNWSVTSESGTPGNLCTFIDDVESVHRDIWSVNTAGICSRCTRKRQSKANNNGDKKWLLFLSLSPKRRRKCNSYKQTSSNWFIVEPRFCIHNRANERE